MSLRLVDYFLVFERGSILTNNDITTSNVLELEFQPKLLERYPREDYKDAELSENIGIFIFPDPLRLCDNSDNNSSHNVTTLNPHGSLVPRTIPFVLTKVDGVKQYGVCLHFYEKMEPMDVVRLTADLDKLRAQEKQQRESKSSSSGGRRSRSGSNSSGNNNNDNNNNSGTTDSNGDTKTAGKSPASDPSDPITVAPDPPLKPQHGHNRQVSRSRIYEKDIYTPKCICVLSHWPFYTLLRTFLKTLYRISLSSPPLPLERFIINFMHEVPVPPMGITKVSYTIADRLITLARPPPNKLPMLDIPLRTLFECFDHRNIVTALSSIATEKRVVIFAFSYTVILHIIEALCALLYPFYWQGVYMPLLPPKLKEFLYAPVPFIAGVHAQYRDTVEIPDEVLILDATANQIMGSSQNTVIHLPEKIRTKLLKRLSECAPMYSSNSKNIAQNESADLAFASDEDITLVEQFATQGGMTVSDSSFIASHSHDSKHNCDPEPVVVTSIVKFGHPSASHSAASSSQNTPRTVNEPNSKYSPIQSRSALDFHDTAEQQQQQQQSFAQSRKSFMKLPFGGGRSVSSSAPENTVVDTEQIRQAFLRVWVKLLAKYRVFLHAQKSDMPLQLPHDEVPLTLPSNDRTPIDSNQGDGKKGVEPQHSPHVQEGNHGELFDSVAFFKDSEDEDKPFLKQLLETQLFSFFVSERAHQPATQLENHDSLALSKYADIHFFDECISAKQNRSKVRLAKLETPFLEDTSFKHTGTFFAPPPATTGLKTARYVYQFFPKLQDSLFGDIRYVQPLIDKESLPRYVANSVIQNMANVMIITNQQARRDWKSVLAAIIKVQTVYRAYRARGAFKKLRKGCIFVSQRLQTLYFTKQARARFVETREAAIVIQAAIKAQQAKQRAQQLLEAYTTLQATLRAAISVRQRQTQVYAAIVVQSFYRTQSVAIKIRHSILRLKDALITFQAAIRAQSAMNERSAKLEGVRVLQAALRAQQSGEQFRRQTAILSWTRERIYCQFIRNQFLKKIRCVIKVQAAVRGMLTRKRISVQLHDTMASHRREMLKLWADLFVPLFYRSKFWQTFTKATFLNAGVHEEEVVRLRALSKDKSFHPKQAAAALEKEHDYLYQHLKKHTKEDIKTNIYAELGIGIKTKKRKQQLLGALWASKTKGKDHQDASDMKYSDDAAFANATQSAKVILMILDDANISGTAILDPYLNIHSVELMQLRKQNRIVRNLQFTVKSSLTSLHKIAHHNKVLHKQLDLANSQNTELKRRLHPKELGINTRQNRKYSDPQRPQPNSAQNGRARASPAARTIRLHSSVLPVRHSTESSNNPQSTS